MKLDGGIRNDANIIAIIVARIGDTLLVTPALRALRALIPNGQLTVLAHPKRTCLLEHLPFIDHLGSIDKYSALWRARFSRQQYQLAVVWGQDGSLINYGIRAAQHTIAFEAHCLPNNSNLLRVARPTKPTHAVRERMLLAKAAGTDGEDLRLAYAVSADERYEAHRWLNAQGKGRWVGIQPVSFPTKAHRNWPLDHFCKLLRHLAANHTDIRFVVLGDATALEAAQHLQATVPGRVAVAAGNLTLRASAALISALDLYIGVDTGPTHIAGALRVPMVALYHCSYPGRNLMPLGHPALRMIEHPATGDVPFSVERSMDEIAVDTVAQAATELLAEGRQ